MITREELIEYAKQANLNLGQAEMDYFQNIILFILSQSYGNGLIFKGGTAMKKCYGLDRFSEDLDFTCSHKVDLQKLFDGLKRFRLAFESSEKEYPNGLKVVLRLKGPLYIGVKTSLCKFIIDFSYRESVLVKPKIKTIGRFMEEVPSFDVFVMDEGEILSEKVRAIMTRGKARDVYDLCFLLKRGNEPDLNLIQKKLDFYDEKWSKQSFKKSLLDKKAIWETELKPLIPAVPPFAEVSGLILSKIC